MTHGQYENSSLVGSSGKSFVCNLSQKETRDKLDQNLPSSSFPAPNVNKRLVEFAAAI